MLFLFMCWHLPILDIASILLQLYYICFVMKQPCLIKLEKDSQLIEKIDIPTKPEELSDDIVEVDFESIHLSKYFSFKA